MILEEYDKNKVAVLNPWDFHSKNKNFPKTCVSFFSKNVMNEFLRVYNPEIIGTITNATMTFNIYKVTFDGVDVAVYQSPVGAPACIGNFEEIVAMGIENIVLVGCCGCLCDIGDYSIIIPDSAIRDEGTSYHYSTPADEVELDKDCVAIVEDVVKSLGLHYIKGKTWTTDAIFRETRDKVNKRIAQGAITVDMECSAMAVVSKYRNINFAQLFYAADNLSQEEYDPRSLINGDINKKARMIPLGIQCAVELLKRKGK